MRERKKTMDARRLLPSWHNIFSHSFRSFMFMSVSLGTEQIKKKLVAEMPKIAPLSTQQTGGKQKRQTQMERNGKFRTKKNKI